MGAIGVFVCNILPYITVTVFLVGFIYRVLAWALTPTPTKIAVFPGQKTVGSAVTRVLLDVVFFRSLLRFRGNWPLWIGSWIFHVSFLLIIIRHLRYFLYPVPSWVMWLQALGIYAGIVIIIPLLYLLIRRLVFADLRFLTTIADYFVLLLLIGIAGTGILLKFFTRVYVFEVKELIWSLFAFNPIPPPDSFWFLTHFFLVQCLLIYFPFSKLMHSGGIFFSPTRTHYFETDSHTKEIEE
jgi:nitrate reductase gamma subunit